MIRNPYVAQSSSHDRLIPGQLIRTENTLNTNNTPAPQPPIQDTRLRNAQHAWSQLFSRPSSTERGAERRLVVLSSENQNQNKPWGDQLSPKPDGITRIFSMNVNGLSLDRRGGRFDELCRTTKEVQADIMHSQEHNLDTTQSSVRSILYDTTRQHWQRSRLKFATSPIPFVSTYKPGGTMTMIVNNLTGRVESHEADHLGRWVSYTLRGRGSQFLTIINVYQVVTDKPGKGLTTAASQQQSLLIQLQDPIIAPPQAFKRDLWTFVDSRIKRGEEIMILGDFNEEFGAEPDGICKLAADFNLVNLMSARHSGALPSTYARG